MHPSTPCPTLEVLFAYAAEDLSLERPEQIMAHLSECPSCRGRLAAVAPRQSAVAARFAQAAPSEAIDESACRAAIERLASLPPPQALHATLVAPTPLPAGDRPLGAAPAQLREYRLLERIGGGGMGAVYRAVHTRLDKVVAVKLLPAWATDNAEAVARFQREMKAVGKLDHPNIVRATDAGEVDGTLFLVMEHIDGLNLAELLGARGWLAIADACELIRQAAVALEHAHAHGLVHRDVKPSNLLLTPTGSVKVLDLGLALLQGSDAHTTNTTAQGAILGTFDYIAPEQGHDAHAVDGRADIYSLGCTLYHLLAGRAPFDTPACRTAVEKIKAHALTPVPPLRAQRPDVPEALAAVLDRLLAKDPAQRCARAAEVADALAPFTAGANLPGLLAGLKQPAAGSAPETLALTSERTAPPRRRWPLFTAAAAAALLVLAATLVLLVRTDSGTLEITSDDNEVRVIVEKGGNLVKIVDLKTQKEIVLNSGKYQLRLEKGDGLELDPHEVTLTRNGKAIAHIKRKAAPQPAAGGRMATLIAADLDEYRAWLERMKRTGYRPTFVHTHPLGNGKPCVVAFAIPNGQPLPWEATTRLDLEEDQQSFNKLGAQGYRPISQGGSIEEGELRMEGLYVKDGVGAAGWLVAGVGGYEAKMKSLEEGKLRPFELRAFRRGKDRLFGILAEPDDGTPQLVRIEMTPAQYEAFLADGKSKGYRPVSVTAYPVREDAHYAAVLRADKLRRDWVEKHDVALAQVVRDNERLMAEGYRPVTIAGYWHGMRVRYLGVWVKE